MGMGTATDAASWDPSSSSSKRCSNSRPPNVLAFLALSAVALALVATTASAAPLDEQDASASLYRVRRAANALPAPASPVFGVRREGRGGVSKFRLRKRDGDDDGDEVDAAMGKRMSMMRLKKPSFMRLRRGPSMMRLKKMTQMRLKKAAAPAAAVATEEEGEEEQCVWIAGMCFSQSEVELASLLAQERL